METPETIQVEVAYARPDEQCIVPLRVRKDATLEEAIRLSGILETFPEVDLTRNKVGIFGKLASLDKPLRAGDRVEIYRPLTADPKEVRRLRAAQEKQGKKEKASSSS
jgi:hypothetical protein